MGKPVRIFGVFSIAALTGVIACTVTSTNPGGGDGGATTPPANNDDAAPGDLPPTDAQCLASGDSDTCLACCANAHRDGYTVFMTALAACVCAGDGIQADDGGPDAGAAKGPCADVCKAPSCIGEVLGNTGEDCIKCVNENSGAGKACNEPTKQGCQTSQDCVDMVNNCVTECPD